MQVVEFSLTIKYAGEELVVSCQRFQVIKVPQIRVLVKQLNKLDEVFTFYEINETGKGFFYFKPKKNYKHLAESIENALIEYYSE